MLNARWDEAAIYRPPVRTNLSRAIADHLRRQIVEGHIGAGRQLPSVKRLAALCEVSVPTAHAAVQILASLGFVRTSPGIGSFVRLGSSPMTAVSNGWISAKPRELMRMRAMIDRTASIALAGHVATAHPYRVPGAIGALAFFAMERWGSRSAWPEMFVKADVAFHREITRLVPDGAATAAVYDLVSQRLDRPMVAAADLLSDDDELHELHHALARAILDGRRNRAGRLATRIARREAAAVDSSDG
ncbi:MAG: GntR family transcriptional regulator [Chloroflexi bacterium]|nr:GntR family transcriptional regulator [Chloroflexota bacterium]